MDDRPDFIASQPPSRGLVREKLRAKWGYRMKMIMAFGVRSICWKATATTTLALMLMYGREAQYLWFSHFTHRFTLTYTALLMYKKECQNINYFMEVI